MKIIVTCNGGFTGSLNLQTGYLRWNKPVPKTSRDVGYLHLEDRQYTRKEIRAIKDATIRYYAGTFNPVSAVPLKTSGTVSRPWKPGEKESALKEIEDAPIIEYAEDHEESWVDKLYGMTAERKAERIRELRAQSKVEEIGEIETTRLQLGGTFQKFFKGRDWLKESEKIRGGKIYIC